MADEPKLIDGHVYRQYHYVFYARFVPQENGWILIRFEPKTGTLAERTSGNLLGYIKTSDGVWHSFYYIEPSLTKSNIFHAEISPLEVAQLVDDGENTIQDYAYDFVQDKEFNDLMLRSMGWVSRR